MNKLCRVDLELITSDEFLDRPFEVQLLYLYLLLNRNAQGIVNKPKAIQRMLGVSAGALEMLRVGGYVLDGDEVGEVYIVDTLKSFLEVNNDGNQEDS